MTRELQSRGDKVISAKVLIAGVMELVITPLRKICLNLRAVRFGTRSLGLEKATPFPASRCDNGGVDYLLLSLRSLHYHLTYI